MSGSLNGIKILDLSRALAGPFCTMILGDLGADVIKVESMPRGDMARGWGPVDKDDVSVYFISCNRNKKDICMDLRSPEGGALLRRLAAESDVVVENFKVGTIEKMGLGFEELSKLNKKAILASISGFGRTGPARDEPGFDQIAQGYSGFMSITGSPETGPTRVGVPIGDLIAGMWLAIGILAALKERENTGVGRHVDTSLLSGLMSLLVVQGQRYLNLGEVPTPAGNAHPTIAPYGAFETSDGMLNIAPATDAMWRRLCEILDLGDLPSDARFETNMSRLENGALLKTLLEEKLKTKSRQDWLQVFRENGIPAGPINDMKDIFNDPQVAACGIVEEVEHSILGLIKQVRSPIRMSGDEKSKGVVLPPPLLGEHTAEILAGLGIKTEEIDSLVERGVVLQAD